MKEDDIRKYASLMKELELTGLEIEMDGAKVRLERGMASSPLVQSYTVPAESVEKKEAAAAEDEGEAVASPMVGVFYTSPAENSDPFVTVGSKVRKGDTICIIEAMKLMNEIAAEFDGIVEKVLAKMMAKKAEEEMHDEDPIGEVIEKLTGGEAEVQPGGEAEDGEEAHVVPAEEMDSKDCGMAMDKAMAAGILKAMRPTVAAIKDEKQRKAVSDALIKCVTAQDAANDIANIMQAAQANAKAKAKPAMDMDKIQASYDALNPHKRKETK